MRSSWVPVSTTSPWWTTAMRLALRMVDRQWAMMTVVRPTAVLSRASWMMRSGLYSPDPGVVVHDQPHGIVRQEGPYGEHNPVASYCCPLAIPCFSQQEPLDSLVLPNEHVHRPDKWDCLLRNDPGSNLYLPSRGVQYHVKKDPNAKYRKSTAFLHPIITEERASVYHIILLIVLFLA